MYILELNGWEWKITEAEEVLKFVFDQYPNAYLLDRSGYEVITAEEMEEASEYKVLIWENEEQSEDDDGSRAIGSVERV